MNSGPVLVEWNCMSVGLDPYPLVFYFMLWASILFDLWHLFDSTLFRGKDVLCGLGRLKGSHIRGPPRKRDGSSQGAIPL